MTNEMKSAKNENDENSRVRLDRGKIKIKIKLGKEVRKYGEVVHVRHLVQMLMFSFFWRCYCCRRCVQLLM